jgi:murein DD-endopeptidase MepM/ murein hydrolase activator NlpD
MLNEKVRRCTHIKTNGIQCGSPAMSDGEACYFHRQAALDFPRRRSAMQVAEPLIDLALIDDADGIHYALMQVMQGMLNGSLESKMAGRMAYTLQVMSANFKQTSFHRQKEDEYKKSNLNAYELWEKISAEYDEQERKRQHEKRVEEIKKLERTCCKCREESDDPGALMPPIPPDPNAKPVEPEEEDEEEQWEIKACEESGDRAIGSSGDRKQKFSTQRTQYKRRIRSVGGDTWASRPRNSRGGGGATVLEFAINPTQANRGLEWATESGAAIPLKPTEGLNGPLSRQAALRPFWARS